jgi:hypothetical protein
MTKEGSQSQTGENGRRPMKNSEITLAACDGDQLSKVRERSTEYPKSD